MQQGIASCVKCKTMCLAGEVDHSWSYNRSLSPVIFLDCQSSGVAMDTHCCWRLGHFGVDRGWTFHTWIFVFCSLFAYFIFYFILLYLLISFLFPPFFYFSFFFFVIFLILSFHPFLSLLLTLLFSTLFTLTHFLFSFVHEFSFFLSYSDRKDFLWYW